MFGSKARRLEAIEKKLALLEAERRQAVLEAERRDGLQAERHDAWIQALGTLSREAAGLRNQVKLVVNPLSALQRDQQEVPGARRLLAWLIIGVLAGSIGSIVNTGLLYWQTSVLSDQLSVLRDQWNETRRQVAEQAADRRIVRKAELLATLYDCRGDVTMTCVPRASRRARAEAALAFIRIERKFDVQTADLSHALMDNTDLHGQDLAGQDFRGARFVGADLRSADLSHSRLRGASFVDANLDKVLLTGADIGTPALDGWSFLTGGQTAPKVRAEENLDSADFTGASMLRTDLRGVDLRGARGLTEQQIAFTLGNADTLLPPGMRRPDGWE